MKNNIFKIAAGALMLTAAMATTSCVDGNDWEVDESYARPFSPSESSFSVTAAATEATVKWSSTPDTEYYIIELSKDSLYEGTSGTAYGEDKSITSSPYVLEDLDSDSKYYIRIKSVSTKSSESKWSYLSSNSFKTKAEQIMKSVGNTDKSDKSVTLHWEAGKKLTRVDIVKGSSKEGTDVAVTKNLDDAAVAAGTITVDGLQPNTTYTACVFNNNVRRGYATFTTYQEAPAADKVIYLSSTDVISNDYLQDLATQYPGQSITLAMAGDATYEVKDATNTLETLKIPDGMAINFYGLPGTGKTKFRAGNNAVDIEGTHTFIKFINLDLGEGQYIINQTNASTVENIVFDDCTVHDLSNTIFRLQGTAVKTITSLTINNCVCTNIGTASYSFVHFEKGGVVNNITISKSTINTQGTRCFISTGKLNMSGTLKISECTLYNIGGSGGRQFIDFGDTSHTAEGGIIFENSIFAKTQAADYRGVRSKTAPSVSSTYITNDWYQVSSGVVTSYSEYSKSSDELFTDPANGVFKINDPTFTAKVGDPRWLIEE